MATRRCTSCGDPYYRRNQTEIWMWRNPGHRGGWQKLSIRLCNKCLSVEQVQQMLYQANVRAVKTGRTYRALPIRVRLPKEQKGKPGGLRGTQRARIYA